ncbi:MAG: HDOD domain-containing protein [Pseudomonadota bacterium]
MTPETLASEVSDLASMPDIAIQINNLLSDPNSSAWDIGRLIEQDPGLSAALLRIANSALYNNGIPVNAIDRAVTVVGTREVRDLAFGVSAVEAFEGISNQLITMEDFWYHSLRTAAAARAIEKIGRKRSGGSMFIAGLLHDIGQLVMFSRRPEQSEEALKLSVDRDDGRSTFRAEREIFGFDHTEVGAALAKQWGLPAYVIDAIRFHHQPFSHGKEDDEEANRIEVVASIVHLANTVAVIGEVESTQLDDGPSLREGTLEKLNLVLDDLPEILSISNDTVDELLRVFVPANAA